MKTLNLQKLLQWAFVDELVKGGGENGLQSPFSAWVSMDHMAQLGIRIDSDRASCDLPMLLEQGEPHKDALLVGQAVRSIIGLDYKISQCDELLSDWPEPERFLALTAYDDVVKRYQARTKKQLGQSVIAHVVTNAVLNRTPCVDAPVPKVIIVTNAGKPCWFKKKIVANELGRSVELEVDGYNKKSGRPFAGAYRKYILNENPQADIAGRIEYQFWMQALQQIFIRLNGNMTDHQLSDFDLKLTPWA